ncbi:MAG: hypothetical protein U5J97_02640 [Trueperaceae bacterium]|nr:hypothetical protein [Trueperaceae bacterium]
MLPYLLASVPAPRLGKRPEVGVADVAATCRRFLSEPRARELADALGAEGEPEEPDDRSGVGDLGAVARAWADLSAQVDDAVVRVRCARDHRDPTPHLQHPAGFRVDIVTAVAAAFEAPHPSARERRLDDLRWRLADELAATSPAGFEALYARAVQLRLAWRREAWDADAGWRVLEASLRTVEDAASGPSAGTADPSAASVAAPGPRRGATLGAAEGGDGDG